MAASAGSHGSTVLDVHVDPVHNRSVLTCWGTPTELIDAMAELATTAAIAIDLAAHDGVHPRLGSLDVCPFVPFRSQMDEAVAAARALADRLGDLGHSVYLYGAAAERPATSDLPSIRRGGLEGLIERELPPDRGPVSIDPAKGVICVGARGPLIAFNVWLRCQLSTAREIAAQVRTASGGPPGIRALGLDLGDGVCQVSMNLIDPTVTGIDTAFEAVRSAADELGGEISATELVGVVEERFQPKPDATAARLLITPGRSIESLIG